MKQTVKTTTPPAGIDDVARSMAVLSARREFLSVALGMSWQLALTVLIPIIAGVKLDQHFHSSPSWTLSGFIIATVGAVSVVWKVVGALNRQNNSTVKATKVENRHVH